ncbi:MAG: DUF805 domain-containing protein [Tateyamaria sp.]|uniref:DUF805 domain-containing protein n=1 Tax=Tateyamaria sp. TaxID=1929288 RepID=UPI00328CBD5F
MGFQDAVKKCLSNYANFGGRAARSEFWWFALFVFLGNFVLSLVDSLLFGTTLDGQQYSVLGGLFSLGMLIPSIAAGVRRLHDLDKSGWWYLLIFIPIIGALVLLFFFVQKGTDGGNRFGTDPLSGDGALT